MNDSKETTVLVTGAAGHLGSHLAGMLIEDGFGVRGLDMESPAAPLPEECEFTQADLSDRKALREALRGVDVVAHTASLHPWKTYTDDQYIDANVKGTWALYALAAELGISRIVLTSSIAAIGYSGIPMDAWPVSEDALFPLGDIYSYTKYTQETIARMYADAGTVRTFALRPPAFMPRPELDTCVAMTGPFCVVDDVASAHVAAVRVMCGRQEPGGPVGPFEAFNTVNRLPYTAEMCREVDGDLQELARRCWPEAFDWLVENGFAGHYINASYDISKAERVLGWQPVFNFEEAFAALTSQ
jgi:nucleoside-diphosphate-sugar epimerase